MLEQKDLQAIADLIDSRVGRTEEVLIGKIDALEETSQYYRISKLKTNNMGLILLILEDFQKRLEMLEKKIA